MMTEGRPDRRETRQRHARIDPKLLMRMETYSLVLLLWITAVANAQSARPNVVVLLSDDLGWKDVGCYGGPVETPTLDSLAESGTRMTDFYSGAAVCSPSRAVLLTGRTNLRCGIYSWINDQDQRAHLPRSEITLAELLKTAGYATAHVGKWHLGLPSSRYPDKPTPSDHGFDEWFVTGNNAKPSHRNPVNFIRNGTPVGPLNGYACDLVVQEATRWLETRSDQDAPFFLNIWFHEPHAPLAAPAELVKEYGDPDDPAAVYSATIANTDRAIARLIQKLHEIDAPENTLVIYASDNGSYRSDRVGHLRGTKGSNYEGGIRVPGIFYWPGHIAEESLVTEPAGLVDVLPTVCGLLGIDPPSAHLDGADLSPLLLQTQNRKLVFARQQPLFWALPLAGPAVAIRDGRYSMLAFRDGRVPRNQEAINAIKTRIEDTLRSKGTFEAETRGSTFAKQLFEGFSDPEAEKLRVQFIRENQFHESWIPFIKQSKFTRFELYDLEQDPSQTEDLSVRLPLVHHRMKSKLESLSFETLREAFDWSSDAPAPGESGATQTHVHRLASTHRSPFDAFVYVNRIPTEPEIDETQDDLAGRILGRLANQEGRVLIKLPPGMDRSAYEGFKTALHAESRPEMRTSADTGLHATCIACHHLPDFGQAKSTPPVPSLRNRSYTRHQLEAVMQSDPHRNIQLGNADLLGLHSLLRTLTDVPDQNFRDLILNTTILDTLGDSE